MRAGTPREDGHPIARSAEPGEDWSWCFVDEVAFVVEPSGAPRRALTRTRARGTTRGRGAARAPADGWEQTKTTLHLWAQIVGKVRLASTAPRNHWWHVPLYVDVRGLTTRRMRAPSGVAFQIDFDFVDHRLVVRRTEERWSRSRSSTGSPSPSSTGRCTRLSRARDRRRDPRNAVRHADDHAVPGRPGARHLRPRRGRALLAHPRLDRRGARGVRRLVLREEEPRASLLALPSISRSPASTARERPARRS